MTPKRVLVIQLRQLGDILLTTPVLRVLKQRWPTSQIYFLSHAMGGPLLQNSPWLTEHLIYEPGVGGGLQLCRQLHQAQFDLVLDFMNNPRSLLFTLASRAPDRRAFASARQWGYTQTVPRHEDDTVLYVPQEKLRLLGWEHEWSSHMLLPELCLTSAELQWGQRELTQAIASSPSFGPIVALSPTHRRHERQWPVERYAQLALRLILEENARILWLWGPGEEEFVRAIQAHCPRPTSLAPQTNIRQLAAVIRHCQLFIGNSNGPSHLAVATDTPSLQLHGPTDARAWCPQTERHQALQGHSMSAISLENVISTAGHMLSSLQGCSK